MQAQYKLLNRDLNAIHIKEMGLNLIRNKSLSTKKQQVITIQSKIPTAEFGTENFIFYKKFFKDVKTFCFLSLSVSIRFQ